MSLDHDEIETLVIFFELLADIEKVNNKEV
jgi:hypothetical protein